jgi:1-acyl-sn-glycerol-3-phosphate acyltransferase
METNADSWRGMLARRIVRWIVHRFYPRVQITDAQRIPQSGPVLLCANHANSLVDPVLIGMAARRPVRFLAKAPLFDVPVMGALMRALGMLPAFRGSDDATQVRRNIESLDTAAQSLIAGQAMGIFPEGKSHDAAHVETVRSGAARVAVQAVEGGAKAVQVVPLGINYEDKERFRSSVWVAVGEPIDMDRWMADHGGESRPAMRALTGELEQRLKQVVVHLDEPQWEPFLNDLEDLVPPRDSAGLVAPLHQRKRIAEAMNHFLAADRPRAEAIGQQIAAYRQAAQIEGVRIDSPILKTQGWPAAWMLFCTWLWIILLFLPALVGTLFHVVPFTIVRAIAATVRPPGRTTVSLYLLAVGLPVYGLWYAACGWWMFGYFTTWFAATCLILMPFLGVLALAYWRSARKAAWLAWHQCRFLWKRQRLSELRGQRQELQRELLKLAADYAAVSPAPPPGPKPDWLAIWRRRAVRAAIAAAVLLIGWFVWHHHWVDLLVDPASGVDLAAIPRATLEARLAADERSLRDVLAGLQELELRAVELQADFAAGRRSYASPADNDAIRQLLLSYINYRTVLVRLIWRYQRYAQLEDEPLRLRAFLVGFTSASALYEAALKFVYQFDRSEETVARLNEGEPAWNIPPGLYDTIQRNLANRANLRLLENARRYYVTMEDRFAAHRLASGSAHEPFHAAIRRSQETAERLGGAQWRQEAVVAAKDLGKLIGAIRYETQSAISTWIGDMKIREPRGGAALIQKPQLDQLKAKLQPGDILLERRNWFLSNAFLPGYWPHAALYVGTTEDLKRLGIHEDPRVQRFWQEYSQPDEEGHPKVIIEALSDGVVFNSLEHSIGGADAAAVLRPRLSQEEIKDAICQAFGHAAKPYDFEFDFTSRDKLVCTEVVFRAYGANAGPIHFPVKQILGRQTMPAIELVRKVKEESAADTAELHFVAFIDSDEATNTAQFLEDVGQFFQTLDRPALTFLQGFEREPARRIGPLGWTLLSLISIFTLGNLLYYGRRGGVSR